MGWPKISFGIFRKMLRKNPSELWGQPNIIFKTKTEEWYYVTFLQLSLRSGLIAGFSYLLLHSTSCDITTSCDIACLIASGKLHCTLKKSQITLSIIMNLFENCRLSDFIHYHDSRFPIQNPFETSLLSSLVTFVTIPLPSPHPQLSTLSLLRSPCQHDHIIPLVVVALWS